MASLELARLWKLHQTDVAISNIRTQAASLDAGKKEQAVVDALMKADEPVGGEYRRMHAESLDLELQNRTLEDKRKKLDKELYGGKIVNRREVENIEKELAAIKKNRDAHDERLLELMELMPPLKVKADANAIKIEEAKQAVLAARKNAVALRSKLETEYAALGKARPEQAKTIPPALLAKYEVLKKNHGTGMADIYKGASCGACGMKLPERTLVGLRDDKVITCEACHRILYFSDGVV